MLIYYIIFIVIIVGFNYYHGHPVRTLRKDGGDARFIILASICFISVVGLRATSVGSDTPQYAERYDNTLMRLAMGFENSEIGFDVLQFIIKEFLGIGYHGFLFFVACFTVGTLFFFIHRYSKDELVSIFIFVLMFFVMYMSGLRQTVAMSICLWAYIAAEKKHPIIFIVLVLIAFTMHNSSILCLITYFIWDKKISRRQAIIIFAIASCSLAFSPLFTPIIGKIAPAKYDKMEFNENYAINFLVLLVEFIFILFSLINMPEEKNEKGNYKFSRYDSYFFILMCLSFSFKIMSIINNQFGRMALYFSVGYLVCVSSGLMNTSKYSFKLRPVIRLIIISLIIAYFTVSIPGDVMEIDNYKFFWE